MDFNIATIQQAIAEAIPDRECVIWRDQRRSWSEVAERARRLANLLIDHGLGLHGNPAHSQPWESAHDHLGCYLFNGPEFLETVLGAHLARVAPFNVNYRYVDTELQQLFASAAPKVIVYHALLAPTLAGILPTLGDSVLLLQVADDSGNELLPGALDYEAALASASTASPTTEPGPDDLHIVFTGGTTGLPKGVLWRIGDVVAGPMSLLRRDGSDYGSVEEIIEVAKKRASLRIMPVPPFIHGAGLWVAMTALVSGGTVIIQDDVTHFDAVNVAELCQRERVVLLSLIGDAMAVPFLDALDRNSYDLRVKFYSNSAAPLSSSSQIRLQERLPGVHIGDGLGSSETGHLGARASGTTFALSPGATVLSEDLTHELTSGSPEIGWLCTGGRHARGYLDHEAKTAATFTTFQGRTLVVSGDRVRLRTDGTVELLGRDSMVINSGGEKIFAEEVEDRLRAVTEIADAAVLGRPHERWGSEVVAVVQLIPGADLTDAELREAVAGGLARYKIPRAFIRAEQVRRGPNGKVDYTWARELIATSP
jgi:acyl-CoA synthetase (AMP-forming)/AMP-acid ligase II